MAMDHSLFPISASALLSLLLCLCSSTTGHAEGDDYGFGAFSVDRLRQPLVCSPTKVLPSANSLKIVDRYGPCHPNPLVAPDISQVLARDKWRLAHHHARLYSSSGGGGTEAYGKPTTNILQLPPVPTDMGFPLGTGNYVITVGVGSPVQNQTVVIDTGSDLCWVQCQPCISCYPQNDVIFDPAGSATQRDVNCTSPACRKVSHRSCATGQCTYRLSYLDGTLTTGPVVLDTLTLTPTDVFPHFILGCGNENRGNTFGREAGLFGLGRGGASLVTQTGSKGFTYCLPGSRRTTGHLTLGGTTFVPPSNARYTPLLTKSQGDSHYHVDLIGISVGGVRVPLPPRVLQVDTILDSGTVLTYLPGQVLNPVIAAFAVGMSQYTTVVPDPSLGLDLCYDFSNVVGKVRYPNITFHFAGGADLTPGFEGVFYTDSPYPQNGLCVGLLNGGAQQIIIGNHQQRSIDIVHDIDGKQIGFGPRSCP